MGVFSKMKFNMVFNLEIVRIFWDDLIQSEITTHRSKSFYFS